MPISLFPIYEVLSLKVNDEEYINLDGKQRRDKVFEAIRLLLIAQGQKKPLVVIIQDLHWMDKTSEEFITYLISSLATTRILLILLYRPEYTHTLANKTFYSQVRVDQLPRKTIEDLVKGILGYGEVEPELIDFIANRTEGNPLFIEEMTCNLLETRAIKKENDRYSLSLKPSDIQVPATIQGIIAARLDRLEGTLKGVMQTASVIGREFAFRILQSVATLKGDLKSSLFTLQDLEFIYEKRVFPELEYIFKHALTQEVAYNSLLIKKRKETHDHVGQAIEQIYTDRLEEFYEMLAHHYTLSENSRKAYHYLKLSGDKAARNFSNYEAIEIYKDAIKALNTQPQSEDLRKEKIKIFQSTFTPMMLLAYPEGSINILQDAEKLALDIGDEKVLAKVYSNLGFYHTYKGNLSCSMEYSEKCFDTAEKTGVIRLIAQSAVDVCGSHFIAGNYVKAVEISSRALQKHRG